MKDKILNYLRRLIRRGVAEGIEGFVALLVKIADQLDDFAADLLEERDELLAEIEALKAKVASNEEKIAKAAVISQKINDIRG
jgi:hypothetical protein